MQIQENKYPIEWQLNAHYSFNFIIGKSVVMQQALELAKTIAPTNDAVLLLGEKGTGKKLFAQAIHSNSKQLGKPFLQLNCFGHSKEIIENGIFENEAASFNKLIQDKKGITEEIENGTLLLHEIERMPMQLQFKLLELLANNENKTNKKDALQPYKKIRIIAATDANLTNAVAEGKFNEELFKMLSKVTIVLPTLNERKEDIPLLIQQFMWLFSAKMNKKVLYIQDECIHCLENYHWKGNVRELKNIIERAIILAEGNEIQVQHLPIEVQIGNTEYANNSSIYHLTEIERWHIQRVLHYTKGNKVETAKLLNIGLSTLYRKIEEYHLQY